MEETSEPPTPVGEFVHRAERIARDAEHHVPSWLRPGDPESRLPVLAALAAAIALELLLVVVLIGLNPLRLTRSTLVGKYASWVLLAAITTDNTLSAVLLDIRILSGEVSNKAA